MTLMYHRQTNSIDNMPFHPSEILKIVPTKICVPMIQTFYDEQIGCHLES